MLDFHIVVVVLHAACAVAAFFIGLAVIFERESPRQLRYSSLFLDIMVAMVVFLIAAIVTHFAILTITKQIIFCVLAVLALFMVWQAYSARRSLLRTPADRIAAIDRTGFDLISLFEGFVIVSTFDLHSPPWLIALVAIAGLFLGRYALHERKKAFEMQNR